MKLRTHVGPHLERNFHSFDDYFPNGYIGICSHHLARFWHNCVSRIVGVRRTEVGSWSARD